MPFVSQAQKKWLEKNKPELAKEFAPGTPKHLPKHVKPPKKESK